MNRRALAGLGAAGVLAAIALAVTVGSDTEPSSLLAPSDPEVVARGKAVYAESCAACHGPELEGQPNWRERTPEGRLPAPPHDETGHTWHHDADTLFRLTKYGVGALIGEPGYPSDMPAYEGVLADDDIIAVLSYIESTWPQEIRARHDELETRP